MKKRYERTHLSQRQSMIILLVLFLALSGIALALGGCGPADQIKGATYVVEFYGQDGKPTARYQRNGADDKTTGFSFEAGDGRKLEIKRAESTDQIGGYQAQGYQQWQETQQFSMMMMAQMIGALTGKNVDIPAFTPGGFQNMTRSTTATAKDNTLDLLTSDGLTDDERLILIKVLTKKKSKASTSQPAGGGI